MQDTGTLKIRAFVTFDRDEFGREIAGKWLTLMTKHNITHLEAQEIFAKVKDANHKDMNIHGTFTIEETLY